jgi:transposase
VEIIVRDRAGADAESGKQGAPDAIQMADLFHLSANASAALDEVLRRRPWHAEHVVTEMKSEPDSPKCHRSRRRRPA